MRLVGAAREDDPLRIAFEALVGHRARVGGVRDVEERRGVVDARGGTHDDGRMVALGQVECGLHHGEALVGRGGIEHGQFREAGEAARVLLGLRRDGARIVGHEQHHAALHAHVVQAHQRVAGDVEPHLLAGEQAARARVRRAGQQLQGRLLIRRPLHVDAARGAVGMQLRHRLDQLGRRRARVARHHAHPGLQRRMRERLVPHQQFLRHGPRPPHRVRMFHVKHPGSFVRASMIAHKRAPRAVASARGAKDAPPNRAVTTAAT